MSKINQIIESVITAKSKDAVALAVAQILSEDYNFKVGDRVAIIDQNSNNLGTVVSGVVKSLGSNELTGYVDVETDNGTVIKALANLLLKAE